MQMKKLLCMVLAIVLALSAISAFAAEYTDKDTVKKVQQALNDAGFDCGTPDGAAGKKTKAAITDYQNANGLTATGVIDDELLVSLGLAEAEAAETTEETPVEAETEETATSEGYTFQGIPWGSSPEEVEAILVETGLIDADSFHFMEGQTDYLPDENDSNYEMKVYNGLTALLESGIGGNVSPNLLKTIGGKEATDSVFCFLYGVEDNAVTSDLHLTGVSFNFFPIEREGFEDLLSGLVDKYGGYTDKAVVDDNMKYFIWKGDNNTVITLSYAIPIVALTYAKADAYQIADQIKAINEAGATPKTDAGL